MNKEMENLLREIDRHITLGASWIYIERLINDYVAQLKQNLVEEIEKIPVNFYEGEGFSGEEKKELIRKEKVLEILT